MPQPSKRSAVLIGAAVFAAVALLSWYLGAPETDEPAGVVEPAAPRAGAQPKAAAGEQLPPGLALSQSPRMAPRDSQAPLFAVRSWAPPPPPPPPPPPAAPPVPPGPPPLPFVMIGMLVEDAGKPTYYLSQGERAYSVTDGEVVDGNYRVKGISGSQLVLTYLPMNAEQSLAVPAGILGMVRASSTPPPPAPAGRPAAAPPAPTVAASPVPPSPSASPARPIPPVASGSTAPGAVGVAASVPVPAAQPPAAPPRQLAPGSGLPAVLVWQGPVQGRPLEEITLSLWARARAPLASVGLTLNYDPAWLTVVRVEEGDLLRRGQFAFAPRIDAAAGRIDINIAGRGDAAIIGEGDLIRVVVKSKGVADATSIGVGAALARTADGRTERLPKPSPHRIRLRP